jgi:GT2 family glycosyltransferase
VIVLSYKNWDLTQAALWSLLAFSDYENLEIIVVDNGSGDEVVNNLRTFAQRDPRIKLVLSERNLGYAAGNNLGLREATGDYLVLLNNDTFVTRGWVRDLIRPLTLDPAVGLVSPLTNNVGNEQKVAVNYSDMEEMADASRAIVRLRPRQRFKTHCVAFFCVAMRRDVFEKIGFLDESYGLGFFEDDDYCKRVIEAGYEIQIVDDAFVHHHLSASFAQLGDKKKRELMERNKAIYEARWGPWKPHSFRDAPGFG